LAGGCDCLFFWIGVDLEALRPSPVKFTTIAGVAAKRIARWDGAGWSALGTGLIAPGSAARAMVAYDDGGGMGLYVAGNFLGAGGAPAGGIARWRGAAGPRSASWPAYPPAERR
jgi:hypothetical protein